MKAIVFDFDEVIVRGSDAVKSGAWSAVFARYDEAKWRPLIDEAQQRDGHGAGGDRFTMMRYVFEKLGESHERIDALIDEGARVFDDHVQEGILRIGVREDVHDLLERLSQRYPLFINTATPREPFLKTVEALGIRQYFKGVYGRPQSKVKNFSDIARELGIVPSDILFLGDSPNDYKAAKEFGCEFIGMATDQNRWGVGEHPYRVLHTLAEFETVENDKPGERIV